MKVLEGSALQEYIQNAITIETDIATQERIITEYRENALSRKPILKLTELPEEPEKPQGDNFYFSLLTDGENPALYSSISLCIGLFFLGMCLVVLIGGVVSDVIGLFVAMVLIGVCLMLPFFIKKKAVKQETLQREKAYERSMEYYRQESERITQQNNVIKRKQRDNLTTWENSNKAVEQKLNQAMTETKSTLDAFYSLGIIYPKYRNLPALTSIYEYLITGRCEGLTGPHGAYNLYEDEVRKDMVISQLSVVIENLEQIKQNQYMLYQQVKEIQKTTDSIESELRQIKGYTVQLASLSALNAYYAALTERNTRITMWCNI